MKRRLWKFSETQIHSLRSIFAFLSLSIIADNTFDVFPFGCESCNNIRSACFIRPCAYDQSEINGIFNASLQDLLSTIPRKYLTRREKPKLREAPTMQAVVQSQAVK